MNETVIIAIIGAVGAVMGGYLGSTRTVAVMEEKIKNIKEDITHLTERVTKHNNLVERVAVIEIDEKTQWKAIDELKANRKA